MVGLILLTHALHRESCHFIVIGSVDFELLVFFYSSRTLHDMNLFVLLFGL